MASTTFMIELHKAYQAGLYTDLKIICGSTEFKVHKIILCSQSKFFHVMCSSSFMEASTNTINLTEDTLNLVARLIDCLYLGTYKDFGMMEDDAQCWKSAHQLHAEMFSLGDKYDCAVLKESALAKFREHTDKTSAQDLLGFITSIPIVYSSTPDSERALRDVAVERVKATPNRFLLEDLMAPYQKVVSEVPEFSWDLHHYWMKSPLFNDWL